MNHLWDLVRASGDSLVSMSWHGVNSGVSLGYISKRCEVIDARSSQFMDYKICSLRLSGASYSDIQSLNSKRF